MRTARTLPRAALALGVALALSLTGCGRFARRGATPSSAAPQNYGNGAKLPGAIKKSKNPKTGTILVTVIDDKGRVLPGAIVRLKGQKKGTEATDAHGRATFVVPTGSYAVDVDPCGTTVIADGYDAFDARVAAGQTLNATLSGIAWHLRYRPEASVGVSPKPPWARNADATLKVHIADGCDVSHVAAGVSIASYRWTASSNFAIVRAASRADSTGYAAIVVRCRSAGDGSIAIRNRTVASDAIELLQAASSPPDGKHWCA